MTTLINWRVVILVTVLVLAGIVATTNQSEQSDHVGWTAYPAPFEFTPHPEEDCREFWLACRTLELESDAGW